MASRLDNVIVTFAAQRHGTNLLPPAQCLQGFRSNLQLGMERQLNAAYRINCIEYQRQSQYGKGEVFYPKTTLDSGIRIPPNMQSTIGIPK